MEIHLDRRSGDRASELLLNASADLTNAQLGINLPAHTAEASPPIRPRTGVVGLPRPGWFATAATRETLVEQSPPGLKVDRSGLRKRTRTN